MNLTIENALHGIDELLRDRIGPAISDPFAAQMARLSGLLLRICANGVDDATELRVTENAAIRALLGAAAPLLNVPLASQMQAASISADPGLKVSVLDAENHRLRGLLVIAQIELESLGSEAAKALDQRIWRQLEAIEDSRAPRE
ncbi:MAG: hypothetical protein RLZZ136_932 [Pseudomonadota bacterium]|jgi:hypothetical protein